MGICRVSREKGSFLEKEKKEEEDAVSVMQTDVGSASSLTRQAGNKRSIEWTCLTPQTLRGCEMD